MVDAEDVFIAGESSSDFGQLWAGSESVFGEGSPGHLPPANRGHADKRAHSHDQPIQRLGVLLEQASVVPGNDEGYRKPSAGIRRRCQVRRTGHSDERGERIRGTKTTNSIIMSHPTKYDFPLKR